METTIAPVVLGIVSVLLLWRLIATERASLADAAERERSHAAEVEAIRTAASELRDQLDAVTVGPLVHKRVIASIAGDEGGVDGILTGWVGDWARFEAVKFVAAKGQVEPVDGAVYVPRAKIIALHEPPTPREEDPNA
jgi:hypothetical protein